MRPVDSGGMGLETEIQMMLSRGVVSGSPETTRAVLAGEPTGAELGELCQILLARIVSLEDAVVRLAGELAAGPGDGTASKRSENGAPPARGAESKRQRGARNRFPLAPRRGR
jgi:hypothetical protein